MFKIRLICGGEIKHIYSLLLVSYILCGCSSTHQITSPADAHTNLENKNGTIFLRNGRHYEAESIALHRDTLTFTSGSPSKDSSLLLQDVRMVKRINRGKGAGNGALLGAATVYLPLIWNLSTNSAYHNIEEQGGHFGLYAMLGVATLAGSGIGALIGTGVGVHQTFLFDNDTTMQEHAHSGEADRDLLRVKHAIKVGIEWGASLTHESRSYSVQPGYSIEFMTGMNVYRASHGAFHLGVEIGYLRMNEYFLTETTAWNGKLRYRTVTERRDVYSLIDLALLPEYTFAIAEDWIGSIYGGVALPSGDKETRTTTITRVVIDSGYYHYPDYLTSPQPIGNPGIYSTGVRIYYKRLMLDLRYRRMFVSGLGKYDHCFADVGFVL